MTLTPEKSRLLRERSAYAAPEADVTITVATLYDMLDLADERDALRAELRWHEERHGTRAEQEAEDREGARVEAEMDAMSPEEVDADLRAMGLYPDEVGNRGAQVVRACLGAKVLRVEVAELRAHAEAMAEAIDRGAREWGREDWDALVRARDAYRIAVAGNPAKEKL